MDNKDLQTILANHVKWLKCEDGERADLQGADLRGVDLRGVDLWGADLRRADLRRADLRRVDLRRADLRRVDLRRADLWGVDLRGVDLRGVNLRGVDLRGANLRGCAGNQREIKSLFVSEVYPIAYTRDTLQIGCERHPIAEWWELSDGRIVEMDGKTALTFWREWKDIIRMIIEKSPAL